MSVLSEARPPTRVGQLTRSLARATAPLSRPLAGRRFFPLWAVVIHRGRRSGREYEVPVAVRVSNEAFVIPLPWGDRTQWLRNVAAAGGCTIRWHGSLHEMSDPLVIGPEEAAGAFTAVQRSVLRSAGVSSFLRLRRGPPGAGDVLHG